jgi:hypothetical protein
MSSPWSLSCMGGWCALRDHCRHYHAGSEGSRPAERLCLPHQDGVSDVVSIQFIRPAATVPMPSQVAA